MQKFSQLHLWTDETAVGLPKNGILYKYNCYLHVIILIIIITHIEHLQLKLCP
jgi:hypothetical protein